MSGPDPFDATLGATATAKTSALAQTIAALRESPSEGGAEGRATLPVAWQRYELHKQIGAGGMGRVISATDKQFGREIAVKQLLRPESADARERFDLESFVTGNLEHPGIPAVYERGQDEKARPFYSMRRVEGRTLEEAIAACGSLTERLRLVPVLIRVAQTLAYAHGQGVVHRDIKPDNIVVGAHGETFVLDWGIAKIRGIAKQSRTKDKSETEESGDSRTTLDGQVIGTPAYMSPEQAAGATSRIDERTDVFALGGLLYHLLTGHPPYHAGSLAEVLRRAKERDLPAVENEAPDAPNGLKMICAKALAKEPDDRFASAEEMSSALESFTAAAISKATSGPVGIMVKAASVVSLLLGVVAVLMTLLTIASLHGQGPGTYAGILFALFGLSFSAIEFSTRGKYRLAPLALGLALATLFNGFTMSASGFAQVFSYLAGPEVAGSPQVYGEVLLGGSREAISSLATGASLATLQILAWAVARRQRDLG